MFKKKKLDQICKNCRLFNPGKNTCQVVIIFEGKKTNIPVDPNDPCFFEQSYFNPMGEKEDFNDIKQVRFWVEDKDGNPTNGDGTVKIECPDDGLFNDVWASNII